MTPFLRPADDGAVLHIYVQPRAAKNEVVGIQGEELKVRLTSPPVEGAANKSCREFFAEILGVSRSEVILIAGDKSRHKRLLIAGTTPDEIRKSLTIRLK